MGGTAKALKGSAKTGMHTNNKTVHSAPSCHAKGSVNKGGGSSAPKKCCGRQSPCDKSKKKSKSCGGGGGGCGKSKNCKGRKVKFKVWFKDFKGNLIPVKDQQIQQVEKDGSPEFPWTDASSIPEKYKVAGYTWDTWDPYPSSVTKDMECLSIWRNNETGETIKGKAGNKPFVSEVTEDEGQKVQNFNDDYLAPGQQSRDVNSTLIKEGKFNIAIDTMVDHINYITDLINNDMDILWQIRETCTDWPTFNDIKKCLLNLQSCYIFQTRMSFNLDFRWSMMSDDGHLIENPSVPEGTPECLYDKIMRYTENLMNLIRDGNGSKLDETISEYTAELDDDIDYYLENDLIAYNEFVEGYNQCVDVINNCFPTDPLEKI